MIKENFKACFHTRQHRNSTASMQSGMANIYINNAAQQQTHTHARARIHTCMQHSRLRLSVSLSLSLHCIGFHFLHVLGLQILIMSRWACSEKADSLHLWDHCCHSHTATCYAFDGNCGKALTRLKGRRTSRPVWSFVNVLYKTRKAFSFQLRLC